ncbi:DgaE family pyridoxal phosphate-dependent ammonia lyase [Roseburia sp. 1XD42-34]|nr:DgaE family pyridoxal phosphate-dependent ammonia lyase [Roseburia sp. 1XD42-34]RKI75721.1 DgaE family pyridoxal phosphate-dependent ammonia lyase [Clostridium sp. 1xD42-85]
MKLKQVINASGRMSVLGVSTLSDTVVNAMKEGAQHYYEMAELEQEAGKWIANYMETEAAMVTNSASSAIVLAVAGLITKNNPYQVEHRLEKDEYVANEIVIMMGHLVDYGAPIQTMIQLGGGKLKVVGYANGCSLAQIESAVTERTCGIFFVQSHHCVQKNTPLMEDVSNIAKRFQVPFIVDAAAEESFSRYAKHADLFIVSGSKAIAGPTSGILAGKELYVSYAIKHLRGIGRAMKIGKESIFGLLQALIEYKEINVELTRKNQMAILEGLQCLNELRGITVAIKQDEAGREIYRARIYVDEQLVTHSASYLAQALRKGEFAIYTRDYQVNNGYFEIDPRPLAEEDVPVIIDKFKQLLS